jgi:hypothetical protein
MTRVGILLALAAAVGCNSNQSAGGSNTASASSTKPGDKPPSTTTAPVATTAGASSSKRLAYPGTADGLKALLTTEFTKTESGPVVAALRPDSGDYAAVFEGDAAQKVQRTTEDAFKGPPPALGKPGDAVNAIAGATANELKDGSGNARNCPGGYRQVGPVLKPDVTIYCAKLGGTSYDGFVFVNGHWAWFPKAFRAL